MLERLICGGWAVYGSVLAVIAGQHAVMQVTAVAQRWADAITAHAAWAN